MVWVCKKKTKKQTMAVPDSSIDKLRGVVDEEPVSLAEMTRRASGKRRDNFSHSSPESRFLSFPVNTFVPGPCQKDCQKNKMRIRKGKDSSFRDD